MSETSFYTLNNQWEKAHRRLQLLEQFLDGATTRRLAALGAGPGKRCLEVASGAGSIARWMADQVGPTGSVTAVDLEPRFLLEHAQPNLAVHRLDVIKQDLPERDYDLIHVRALLMHLAERQELLAKLVAHLRPGGWLLVEECDLYPTLVAGPPAWRELWAAIGAAVAPAGSDWFWARYLPEAFVAAGARDIGVESVTPVFAGGSGPAPELYDLTFEQLTPRLLEHGASPKLIERARAELADQDLWFHAFAVVATWGTR